MAEFKSRWLEISPPKPLATSLPKPTKPSFGSFGRPTQGQNNRISSNSPASIAQLLRRLQAGSQWPTNQTFKYIGDDTAAASNETFSQALEGWVLMEQQVRNLGYTNACIFSPEEHCPADAPVNCDWCVLQSALKEVPV